MNVAAHISMKRGQPVDLPLEPDLADEEAREWLEAK
jgi:hypothetical protein